MASWLIQAWSQTDRNAAIEWIDQHPEGRVKVNLVSNLIATWANEDVEGAADYALRLDDANARASALGNVVSNWTHQDLEGARGFIDRLDPGEQPALVRRMISNLSHSDIDSAVRLFEDFLPSVEHGRFANSAANIASNWASV